MVLSAVTAGAGAREVLAAAGEGRVAAWFRRACYLESPGGLVALVPPSVPDGPLHVRLDRPLPRLDPGTAVLLSPAVVEFPGGRVTVAVARPWVGDIPDPSRFRAAAPTVATAVAEAASGSLLSEATAREVRTLLGRDDLEGAARVLAGRGPGLTPSGDDALGGALFGLRVARGPAEEPRLAAVAHGVRTTTIARAFLRWAARGQALATVHALLGAAVRDDLHGARAAGGALAGIGESSGADFALGLLWVARAAAG